MIDDLLERIYAAGQSNDATATDRARMMFNITPSTGRFLDILVGDAAPRRILEIGTSNGYSTIWLARAAGRVGATINTVDSNTEKHRAADRHLREAGLDGLVTLHTADAGVFLSACLPHSYDFVFLDSDRSRYVDWAPALLDVIDFGLLVVDNALSHPQEIAPFRQLIRSHADLDSVVLPIGKGQLVVRRRTAV